MKRNNAEELMKSLLKLHESLNQVTNVIDTLESQEIQKKYKKAIGLIIGRTYTDLMLPIIMEYPDLDPDQN